MILVKKVVHRPTVAGIEIRLETLTRSAQNLFSKIGLILFLISSMKFFRGILSQVLPTFIQLVFQPLTTKQTSFLNGDWLPCGLYLVLITTNCSLSNIVKQNRWLLKLHFNCNLKIAPRIVSGVKILNERSLKCY